MTNTEVVSLIIGGLFIVETLSVMIQVVYFHFTHKRVFLMAPIHHHFEKKGWAETKVVIRFLDYRCGLWCRWPCFVLPVGIVVFHASC